jgi:hypothetical protein
MTNENVQIHEHIGIFDDFMPIEMCANFINLYHYRSNVIQERHEKFREDSSILFGNTKDFRESMAMLISKDDADPYISEFNHIFWSKCYPIYKQKYTYLDAMEKHSLGYIKLQKTSPGQGYHGWHSENASYMSSKRFAFVIAYLNTIENGGETEFLYQGIRVQPIAGRIVIAPSSYTHLHRGNPPLDNDKYILTSWLEYLPQPENL